VTLAPAPVFYVNSEKVKQMQATEMTIRYGIVRVGGKGVTALYDVVRHTPGQADEVLARGAVFDHATAIVKALNAEAGA
jgi:hypothetical protein